MWERAEQTPPDSLRGQTFEGGIGRLPRKLSDGDTERPSYLALRAATSSSERTPCLRTTTSPCTCA